MEAGLKNNFWQRNLRNSGLVPRGDLIAFTKMHKGKFYIGVMRTDGTGERLLTENYYQEAPSLNGRVLVFYRETKAGLKGEGFSAKLWSDITGYNERRLSTKPTLLTHLGLHYYLSEVEFYVKYT